jgi:hypothetical protein
MILGETQRRADGSVKGKKTMIALNRVARVRSIGTLALRRRVAVALAYLATRREMPIRVTHTEISRIIGNTSKPTSKPTINPLDSIGSMAELCERPHAWEWSSRNAMIYRAGDRVSCLRHTGHNHYTVTIR